MIRILIQYLVPILGPFVLYALWVVATRGRGEPAERLLRGPWPWLLAVGVVLLGTILGVSALRSPQDPGAVYHSPRFEGGRVVPGGFGAADGGAAGGD